MIDPTLAREYRQSLSAEELALTFRFGHGVSDRQIEFAGVPAREVLREYFDSGEVWNTVGFWKRLLRKKLQVPLHVVQLVVLKTNAEDGAADLVSPRTLQQVGLTPGKDRAGTNKTSPKDVKNIDAAAADVVDNENDGKEDIDAEEGERAAEVEDSDDDEEPDEPVFVVNSGRVLHAGDDLVLQLPSHSNRNSPTTTKEEIEYRVVCNERLVRIEQQRNDLHRLKWFKLNALGPERVSEFFYLEKWREHVDFASKTRSGWRLLLPKQNSQNSKDELIGHKNIERAFYDYPSKVDAQLYDILLHQYPYEKGCYNKAEFYRLCHENTFLAHAIVEHPGVDIPDSVLNVVDPTGCTLFNNKPVGSEELGLCILEKYGARLQAKMLNALVVPQQTSCLTRAIVAGYERLAMRLLALREPMKFDESFGCEVDKPMLGKQLLTEDCKQGYAVYHRQYGRQFSKLAEFPNQYGRYPKPYDIALILGMPEVADQIEALIQEWEGIEAG
eukprot:g16624.t1